MKTLKISDIPTLERWVGETTIPDDNAINGYIKELGNCVGNLLMLENDYVSPRGEEPSEEYTTLNEACRLLAVLIHDMKAIRNEVATVRLLNANNLMKGGKV